MTPDDAAIAGSASNRLYVALMRLTAKGLAELSGSADRRKVSATPYDFIQVFEMPDNEAMMQHVLTAWRDGFVDPLILPAFDPPTFGRIVGNILT